MRTIMATLTLFFLAAPAAAYDLRACRDAKENLINDNKIEFCFLMAQKLNVPADSCIAQARARLDAADIDAVRQHTANHRHDAESSCAR